MDRLVPVTTDRHAFGARLLGGALGRACLSLLLLLAAVSPAGSSTLEFLEVHTAGVGNVEGTNGAQSAAVSPDGAHVYIGGSLADAIAVFARDETTGSLAFVHAVYNGVDNVEGLDRIRGVAVSPDGAHVYAAGNLSDAVAVFERDPVTGMLTYVEVHKEGVGSISSLDGAHGVTVSPDGAHVYVASLGDGAVTVFSRDPALGTLSLVEAHVDGVSGITSLAGAEAIVVSPDGGHVYVAAQDADAVTVFSRDASTGSLTFVEAKQEGVDGMDGLAMAQTVDVSPDGNNVYVGSAVDNAIVVFDRDATTGALTVAEVQRNGVDGVGGLEGLEWLQVSPDGGSLYTVSDIEDALVVFRRDPTTGGLTFLEVHRDGFDGIFGLDGAEGLVVSPDSAHVYSASDTDDAVAVFGNLCGNGRFDAGEECDDGNREGGDCCSATCVTEPAGTACADDGNVCTDDKCNAAGICLHVNNTVPCDDGLYCTINDTCQNRVCVGAPRDCSGSGLGEECRAGQCDESLQGCVDGPVTDGTPCDDGDACTVSDTCISGGCIPGDPVICEPLDQCHAAGACDPATGLCSTPDVADGTPCDDGDACTQADVCVAGVCVGADPVVCAPPDPCHFGGLCDAVTGQCAYAVKVDGTACDDGDLCTLSDSCVAGVCVGGDPVVCTAVDQCRDGGVCDPSTGLCSGPAKADGTACDDGDLCTRSDSCVAGTCVGADPVVCTAPDQCHDVGICDPLIGQCSIQEKADGSACDDGDACTQSDICLAGTCAGTEPVICAPPNDCHDAGTCDSATGQCTNPVKADGTACDDGDLCTQEDTCQAGVCAGANPVICSPLDDCHEAGTCDPTTGQCVVQEKADGSACDDGDPCTQSDICVTGACVGTDPVSCPTLDECHEAGACDPATGQCTNPVKPDGTLCDDGNLCTETGVCSGGVCLGGDPVTCPALDQCHDAGVCDPATGQCSSPAKADGTACDDGEACSQADRCVVGSCVGTPVVCTPLDDCHEAGVCDPATGQCSNPVKPDGATVVFDADADAYTDVSEPLTNFGDSSILRVDGSPDRQLYLRFWVAGIDGFDVESAVVRLHTTSKSTAGSDTGGNLHQISDGSWDELTLTHANRPAIDGPVLVSVGPVSPSQVVDFDVTAAMVGDGVYNFAIESASSNAAIYASREAGVDGPQLIIVLAQPCDDGDLCTEGETCVAGNCVGGIPVVCTALDGCYEAGVCDPATGCSNPIAVDGTACDDGDLCTQSDVCVGGVCVGSDPVACAALDECHEAGVCDPATGVCSNPTRADGTACDDGNLCTQADACVAGVCLGGPVTCVALDSCHEAGVCDPVTGQCSSPVRADGAPCDDGNRCTQTDVCLAGVCMGADPLVCTTLDECHEVGVCDPATGACSNPTRPDGTTCDDGNLCTRTDACVVGVCTGGDPVTCTALDQCHEAGTCDPTTGQCSNPKRADGTTCDDGAFCTVDDACVGGTCRGMTRDCGEEPARCVESRCDEDADACVVEPATDGTPCDDANACTQTDACMAGACAGTAPVICRAFDQCHEAGVCDPTSGRCSNPAKPDGEACDDADVCSENDQCIAGTCVGVPLPDGDGDGFCDTIDVCPTISDPSQGDDNRDGIGDGCQCAVPAPGRCIAGGGSKKTDCMLEFLSAGPASLNKRGTKVKSVLECMDGDPACDLDGAADGTCTFGVSLCFGNRDPRFPACAGDAVRSVEVLKPNASTTASADGRNAAKLEQALSALGLEVRRRGRVIAEQTTAIGNDVCTPMIHLATPAPNVGKGKRVRRKFRVRATSVDGRRDKDRFVLLCR